MVYHIITAQHEVTRNFQSSVQFRLIPLLCYLLNLNLNISSSSVPFHSSKSTPYRCQIKSSHRALLSVTLYAGDKKQMYPSIRGSVLKYSSEIRSGQLKLERNYE